MFPKDRVIKMEDKSKNQKNQNNLNPVAEVISKTCIARKRQLKINLFKLKWNLRLNRNKWKQKIQMNGKMMKKMKKRI